MELNEDLLRVSAKEATLRIDVRYTSGLFDGYTFFHGFSRISVCIWDERAGILATNKDTYPYVPIAPKKYRQNTGALRAEGSRFQVADTQSN